MAKKQKQYKRLPGRGTTLALRHSLWLGPDHLLAVQNTGYSERYQRFHYEDIQAICATRTSMGAITNWVCAIIMVLTSLLYLGDPSALFAWIFFPGPVAVVLVVNLLLGTTCKTRLFTAVQTVELPSLNRFCRVAKAVPLIREKVVAAQGAMSTVDVVMGLRAAREARQQDPSTAAFAPDPLMAPPPPMPPALTPEVVYGAAAAAPGTAPTSRKFHLTLFVLLLVDALASGLFLLDNNLATLLFAFVSGAAVSVAAIVALVRQSTAPVSGSVRGLTWGALAYVVLGWFVGYALLIQAVFTNKGKLTTNLDILAATASRSPWDSEVWPVLWMGSILASLFLGIAGLALLPRRVPAGPGKAPSPGPAPPARPL